MDIGLLALGISVCLSTVVFIVGNSLRKDIDALFAGGELMERMANQLLALTKKVEKLDQQEQERKETR